MFKKKIKIIIMNVLRTYTISKETTRNTNRFTLVFGNRLTTIIQNAQYYTGGVRDRYLGLKDALNFPNISIDKTLELSLFSVSLPQIELQTTDIFKFNDSYKSITKFSPTGDMAVSFYDYVSGSASAIMLLWHGLCGDKKTGAIGYKEDYVIPEADFYVFGPDAPAFETLDPSVPIEHHKIINLYPRSIEMGEHSFESGDVRKVTVQFVFDNIYPVSYRGMPKKAFVPGGNP